ncbi:MAG: hypothetical protein HY22_14315, partial [[Candidatus Thermochlorobacteriaceae] bacterium GBChlB]
PQAIDSARHFPNRIFSGKQGTGGRGAFFCYRFPNGIVKWYLHRENGEILEDKLDACFSLIQCTPETPRLISLLPDALYEQMRKVEETCVARYLRDLQLPSDQKPTLVCCMGIS